ncbi:unnamed protein product, partial [Meganyctiphanes norvegica]
MDSGIDSTESSNGSLAEASVPTTAATATLSGSDMAMEEQGVADQAVDQASNIQGGNVSSIMSNINKISSMKVNEAVIENTNSPMMSAAAAMSTPSALQMLIAATTSVPSASPSGATSLTPAAVTLFEFFVIRATGPDASKWSARLRLPQFEIPEGSRLRLHFSYKDGQISTDSEVTEEEPPPGLTFANISPSMYLSTGYEAFSQGYAVRPYENNVLQKKLRSLRLRFKQRHQQIMSVKAKERKLRISASLNNVECVETLLKEGVDPKVSDDKQRSPLHIAASKGYTEIVKLLLQHGADPNQKDGIGNTALHLAACTSHIPTVTLLLRAGTNVRQADNQGYSPLHLAKSKLKLLQRDNNASSQDIKKHVYQVLEMMQTFLKCSGNAEDAELLTSFSNQLSLSDSRPQV